MKAVIFDLDGTLLDTLDDLAESLNAMLEGLGYQPHSVEVVKGFIGDGMENLVRRAAPADDEIDDALIARCLALYKDEYDTRWNAKTRAYDGIPALLTELQRRRIPMGVLSNKADAFTKMCIAEYFPGVEFSAVLGQRDGIPKKPDPSGALEIATLWALPSTRSPSSATAPSTSAPPSGPACSPSGSRGASGPPGSSGNAVPPPSSSAPPISSTTSDDPWWGRPAARRPSGVAVGSHATPPTV